MERSFNCIFSSVFDTEVGRAVAWAKENLGRVANDDFGDTICLDTFGGSGLDGCPKARDIFPGDSADCCVPPRGAVLDFSRYFSSSTLALFALEAIISLNGPPTKPNLSTAY